MKIKLLATEAECLSVFGEGNRLHAENARVKCTSRFDVANSKNKVVKAVDLHRRML